MKSLVMQGNVIRIIKNAARGIHELLYYQNKVIYSLPVTAIRSKIYIYV